VQAVDHHCHPLRRWPFTLTALELRTAFSEALDPQVATHHVQHSAAYQGALRRIARELGCEPDEATVLARRNAIDPQGYARRGFRATATGMMLVDTGFPSADSFTIEEQATALDIPQREIVRLETLAEALVDRSDHPEDWLSGVRRGLTEAVNRGAVGVKTICAYRASLNLRQPDTDELADAFDALKQRARGGAEAIRLSGDPLCHALLLDAARECVRLDVPLQVHCGFGDPDEDLAQASPLGLRPLFVDPTYRGLRVALLHCYPYHREAAYLCSVFPNVYMDLSLAIPFAAQDGARAMQEALGLCPTSKLLYASDASRYPEVFFVAATLHREALAQAISELIDRDVLGTAQAIEAGRQVLAGNARRVYRLGAA
jgi:uncharacterized protein